MHEVMNFKNHSRCQVQVNKLCIVTMNKKLLHILLETENRVIIVEYLMSTIN